MKILHIITSIDEGGAESSLYRLVVSNSTNLHSVVSLSGGGKYANLLKESGVSVYIFQMKNIKALFNELIKFRETIKQINPDIIQCWMYHANLIGGIVSFSLGIRSIFWNIRTANPQLGNFGKTTQKINLLNARLARYIPKKIITCAYRATETHVAVGYPPDKIITICNGYDFHNLKYSRSSRISYRKNLNLDPDTILFGTVARWDPQKDHETLLAAFSRFNAQVDVDWRLLLVGPGMATSNTELTILISRLNLSHKCILEGPQDNISSIMSALDIHVLTSTDEGFPNVLVEAMACKTPCISSDVGDASQIISETGWIVPKKSPNALSAAAIEAATEYKEGKDLWEKRCIDSVRHVKNKFSIETMIKQYEKCWSIYKD